MKYLNINLFTRSYIENLRSGFDRHSLGDQVVYQFVLEGVIVSGEIVVGSHAGFYVFRIFRPTR